MCRKPMLDQMSCVIIIVRSYVNCVVCERHEVQSCCFPDSKPRPSDLWSDTLPLDQLSSTRGILGF